MDRIICVVGPTASGKTKLAVQLAKLYDGEVVSCDSMQIYKHMDIGMFSITALKLLQITAMTAQRMRMQMNGPR